MLAHVRKKVFFFKVREFSTFEKSQEMTTSFGIPLIDIIHFFWQNARKKEILLAEC